MGAHIRACGLLLGLTLLICAVLYPAVLWVVGRVAFPSAAEGSLVRDGDGVVRGSRLLAQPFSDPKYFWPRPSAVGYNAAGSGGSNWSANNPLLRDRVARQLGPLVRYESGPKAGQRVGPDVESWFRANPGLLGRWAKDNPTLAVRWVKDDENKKGVLGYGSIHEEELEDKAVQILERFAAEYPTGWPKAQEDGKWTLVAAASGDHAEITDLQAVMFDPWLRAHLEVQLRKVPADMVLASGSGLDPHITLSNARYQLEDRVAGAWAKDTVTRDEVLLRVEGILQRHAFRPLAGLTGEPLVNVLEVNLQMQKELGGR
jgi:K+-transporting ATPase ATPase C chain